MVKNGNVRHHGANSSATAGIRNLVFLWDGWIRQTLATEVGQLPGTVWHAVKEKPALWVCQFVFMNLIAAVEWLPEAAWFYCATFAMA